MQENEKEYTANLYGSGDFTGYAALFADGNYADNKGIRKRKRRF